MAINQARHLGSSSILARIAAGGAVPGGAGRADPARPRSPRPIIAPRYFRLPGFALLNAANALVNLAAFAVLLFVPYYLARIAVLPTALAGLVLAASPAGTMLASAPTGWLLGRVPARRIAGLGIGLTAAGLGLGACWDQGSPLALLVAALLLHGAGSACSR